MSVRRACAAVKLSRGAYYHRVEETRGDEEIVDVLNELVDAHPGWGFRKCFDWMRRHGHSWNHKRVWRVYCAMRLNLKRRTKKRVSRVIMVSRVDAAGFDSRRLHHSARIGLCSRVTTSLTELARLYQPPKRS